jgi:serine/threonine-protein kinase
MNNELHCRVEDLRDLIDGRLGAAEEPAMIRHLDDCDACRQTLDGLSGGEPWAQETGEVLRSLLATAEYPGRAGAGDEIADVHDASEIPQVMLKCLAPTDDPAMLGRLGIYEIAGIIGCGGAGIVFKALERSLNRFVAVKVLSPILACNAAARKRFAREAKAAAAVVHEHVVPIYAVDEFQGLPFLVMQYVPGRSLQHRLNQQGPLGIREILRIGHQAALGLAAAHAQGVVHRDIKPANMLIENGVERLLLTDFGLARTVDDASLTCSGVIAGTPEYMSPEQARGEAVDHRSDLFSLGSVLFALCTGHSPFRAGTTMGILQRICHDRPRSIRDVNSEIPEALCEFINRLLDKQPGRRPQTAAEVAEWCAARLVELQSARPMARQKRLRIKTVLPWAAAAAIAVGGIASATWWENFTGAANSGTDVTNSELADLADGSAPDVQPIPVSSIPPDIDWAGADREIAESRFIADRLERETNVTRPLHADLWATEVNTIRRVMRPLEESLASGEPRATNN